MPQKIIAATLHDGQVIRLTLNAPKANVLDAEMMSELHEELKKLHDRPEVKLIEFAATGDNFSFGASVAEHTREKADAMLTQFHALFFELAELAIPTAALVSGQCLGGAMELILMCNFLFVDKTARLGQPEIMLGVFPPPASLLLPMKVGQAKADEIILTGRSLKADEAAAIGLAIHCYENREEMGTEVDEWVVKNILPKSPSSLRYTVRAARWQFNKVIKEELNRLQEFYVKDLMATHDANEGIQSFLEKRKPVWQH
jgi:cyclohexa-1,5-dienecarbonyl-CoA hydratase